MKIAIGILSYGRVEELSPLLKDISNLDGLDRAYIHFNEELTSKHHNLLLSEKFIISSSKENKGVAGGRNFILKEFMSSDSDAIWILDDDVRLNNQDYIHQIKSILKSDELSLIAGKIVCGYTKEIKTHELPTRNKKLFISTPSMKQVPYFVGASFVLTRKAIQEVGFFREDLGIYAPEDFDYGIRSTNLGFKIFYSPIISVDHYYSIKGRSDIKETKSWNHLARLKLSKDYFPFKYYIQTIIFYSLKSIISGASPLSVIKMFI